MKSSILIGLLTACSGALSLFVASYLYLNAHPVETIRGDNTPRMVTIPAVSVDNTTLIQVTARCTVETFHRKQIRSSDGIELKPLYKIPLTLTLHNSEGTVVHTQQLDLEPGGMVRSLEIADDQIIDIRSVSFDKFASSDTSLSATLSIGEDTEYAATISTLSLTLYDNVFKVDHFVASGIPLVLLGFLLVMYGWTAGSSRRNYALAIIFAALGGSLGLDRFYLGYFWLGILKCITFGGCGIWALIDLIMIITKNLKNAQGDALE